MSKIRIGQVKGNHITIGDGNTVVNESAESRIGIQYSDEELVGKILKYLYENASNSGLYLIGAVLKNVVHDFKVDKVQLARVKTILVDQNLVEVLQPSYRAGDSRVKLGYQGIELVNSMNTAVQELERNEKWTLEDFNEIVDLKPNIGGFGINLNALFKIWKDKKKRT